MRFLLVLVSLSFVCAAVYFTILFWGQGRPITRFEHAFDLRGKPFVLVPWDSELNATGTAVTLGTWIDVYRDSAGLLRALHSADRPLAQDPVSPKIENEGPLLKTVLAPLSETHIVLNIVSNAENIDLQLSKEFEGLPKAKVLVQSEFDNVMSSIKKAKPMWSYGTSASDRVRWLTFSSIGLLPAVTVTGDVYVSPLKIRKLNALNADIVTEAHRRFMSVILGPLATEADVVEAKTLDADGYFVTTSEALSALKLF